MEGGEGGGGWFRKHSVDTQQVATQAKLASTSQSCVGPYYGVALTFKTVCAPKMQCFGGFFVAGSGPFLCLCAKYFFRVQEGRSQ